MPVRNKDLFNQIASTIEQDPDSYCQSVWGEEIDLGCGTAHCIAGHAVAIKGYLPFRHEYWGQVWAVQEPGKPISTFDLAMQLLGLTRDEADTLFDQDWTPGQEHDCSVPKALRAFGDGAPIR